MVVQWDQPEEPNGQVTGYKVFYTAQPSLPITAWTTQTVDSNQLTTISDLQSHMIYTIRVQAFTSRGPGPLSGNLFKKIPCLLFVWLIARSTTVLPYIIFSTRTSQNTARRS